MNTCPCTLTKALDEADDTSPAPLSWHFHGAENTNAVYKIGRNSLMAEEWVLTG